MNKPMSAAQAQAQNLAMRQAFLTYGQRMQKKLNAYTDHLGGTTRVQLFNVGVLTSLLLEVQADITIGTAIATPSSRAPYNLISRVRVTDFDGTDRVNISGFQLWVLNCKRRKSAYGYNNEALAAVFTNPQVPTAIGNGSVRYLIEVPLAFDVDNPTLALQDTSGAILAQTNVGEMWMTIDWITSLYANGDIDSLYSGAATTTVVGQSTNFITLTVWQKYIMPQPIPNTSTVPMPLMDFQTVYELVGNIRSNDNLAVGAEKLLNYPNVRRVIGAYFNYVTGGAVAYGNMTTLRQIANGNNIITEDSELSFLFQQRRKLNTDLVAGTYIFDHEKSPVQTALYGNYQAGLTPATVSGGNQYVELMYESFYTKGAALPGVSQASG